MNTLKDKRFVLIGVGNIGCILLERLLAAGVPPQNLAVCDANPERARRVAERFHVIIISLSDEAIGAADAVLISVPPKAVTEVIRELSNRLHAKQLVVSFAAAVPLERLEATLLNDVFVARVMPNAPSLVGQGMNPVAYGAAISSEARMVVESILRTLGQSIVVNDAQMNWCVGLTGASMRSLLPALEGMTQAGIEAGFAEEESRQLAAQVMLGTTALVLEGRLSLDEIKSLTPMETLDETALRKIFVEAACAAKEKTDRLQQRLEQV